MLDGELSFPECTQVMSEASLIKMGGAGILLGAYSGLDQYLGCSLLCFTIA